MVVRQRAVPAQDVHRGAAVDPTAVAVDVAAAYLGRTVVQAARDFEVSWPVANTALTAEAARPKDTAPVTHLGIDETRRWKAKFRLVEAPDGGEIWEVVADRWHVGLVDLVGGAGLLGQVEGRTAASVSAWIGAQTRQWRAGVQVVAIDMRTVFKAAVRDSLQYVST